MTKLVFPSLDAAQQNFALLELIADTHAWVKDREGRFVYGNRLFFERFGFTSMQGLLGRSDYDLAPVDMAEQYRRDDAQVLNGLVINDRLELILGRDESVEWFLTSKWPIYDVNDQIIGTCGISRHLNQAARKAVPYRALSAPIDYINANFHRPISVSDLAIACNLSVSALERRFRKHLGKTPLQYLLEVRLEHASRLLNETEKPIGTIALETGFADHSHFSRAFRKHYGRTPKAARNNTA